MKKRIILSIILVCSIITTYNSTSVPKNPLETQNQEPSINHFPNPYVNFSDINILLFAAPDVGENYFDVKNQLLNWNISVTTVGTRELVYSCNNRGNAQPIDCDLLYQEFILEDFEEYDALFIPSGGYWANYVNHPTLKSFILNASTANIYISSMCVGTTILAGPEGLIENRYITGHANGATTLRSAGVVDILYNNIVVIDGNIITGGQGGGFNGGGHTVAPYPEFSACLLRCIAGLKLLNKSYMVEPNASSSTPTLTTFQVDCHDTSSFYDLLPDVQDSAISWVRLEFFAESNENYNDPDEILILSMENATSYIGEIELDQNMDYSTILKIQKENTEIEIYHNIFVIKADNNIVSFRLVFVAMVGGVALVISLQARRMKK